MNDKLTNCDARAEAISLLAAEILSPAEEQQLRQHFACCQRCREQFEQASIVVAGLRAARTSNVEFDRSAIVARTMAQVANEPAPRVPSPEDRPSPHADTSHRGVKGHTATSQRTRRWQLVALALAGCAVAIGVVGRSLWRTAPSSEVVVRVNPHVEPLPPAFIEQGSHTPTLMELRRAVAVSDEALDHLLAQSSSTLSAESFSSQTLWQESLQ